MSRNHCTCSSIITHSADCASVIIDQLRKELNEANRKIEWLIEHASDPSAIAKFKATRSIPSGRNSIEQRTASTTSPPPQRPLRPLSPSPINRALSPPRQRPPAEAKISSPPPQRPNRPQSPPPRQISSPAPRKYSAREGRGSVYDLMPSGSPPASRPPSGGPMIESQFISLLEKIKTANSNIRVKLVRDAADQHMFTCNQLDKLVSQLTFADEREECAEILASRLLDPESFPAIVSPEVRSIIEKSFRRATISIQGDNAQQKLQARELVLNELISTEQSYVQDLELVVKLYIQPIEEKGILSKQELTNIFSNIQELLSLHKQILKDFGSADTNGIGDVFLRMADFMKMYNNYCTNQPTSLETIEKCKKKIPKFAALLQECIDHPESKGLTLFGFLIKPVQRLCKYPLLLKELLSNTPNSSTDFFNLKKALDKINEIVDYVNERKRLAENLQRILEIQNSIEGLGELDLVKPTRRFINEGTVKQVKEQKKKTKDCKMFLFNDLILWARIIPAARVMNKPTRFKFAGYIPLNTLRIVVFSDTEDLKNAWQLVDKESKAEVTMFTESLEEKNAWISEIKSLIKEYMKQALQKQAQDSPSTSRKASQPQQQGQQLNTRTSQDHLPLHVNGSSSPHDDTPTPSPPVSRIGAAPQQAEAEPIVPFSKTNGAVITLFELMPLCDRCQEVESVYECVDCKGAPFCADCFAEVHSVGKYKAHVSKPVTMFSRKESPRDSEDEFADTPEPPPTQQPTNTQPTNTQPTNRAPNSVPIPVKRASPQPQAKVTRASPPTRQLSPSSTSPLVKNAASPVPVKKSATQPGNNSPSNSPPRKAVQSPQPNRVARPLKTPSSPSANRAAVLNRQPQ